MDAPCPNILRRLGPRPPLMGDDGAVVFVVDDDAGVCDAIRSLLASVGLEVQTFESASKFPGSECPEVGVCLTKPFRAQQLMDAVQPAIACDRVERKQCAEVAEIRRRYESLTPREFCWRSLHPRRATT